MSRFTSYDSWEEGLKDMNEAKYDADRAVLRWQWNDLMPGTFAIRIADGLLIYTEVLDDYKEDNTKGFVFGKHYSVACPNGELGDAHRSTFLAMIPKESFLAFYVGSCRSRIRFEQPLFRITRFAFPLVPRYDDLREDHV